MNTAPWSGSLRHQLLEDVLPPRDTAMDRPEAEAGRAYRRRVMALELIRDFTEMASRFEPPPYGEEPVKDMTGWHPADNKRLR